METRPCIQLYACLMEGSLLIWFLANCMLGHALSSEVVGSAESNDDSPNPKAFCSFKKFLTQSYYERYKVLVDLDFDNFMSQEVPCGHCKFLLDNYKAVIKVSDLKRNVIGEGSHRRLSTSIKIQTQRANSASELSSYSCQFIILERLPSGVFADPFELQHLVQRGVFHDIAVFGDTNLELPSFLSNRSSVEIHLDVDQNILLAPTDIKVELPLHARYQPLNESGYSTVEFGAPDILMRCSKKENVENQSCFVKVVNDANSVGADIVWKIPSGRKAHAQLVSVFTFVSALLSTFLIVWTSLRYSNIRLGKTIKQV